MPKIYTTSFNSTFQNQVETVKGPSADVVNNILNFSKALEVLKTEHKSQKRKKPIEIVLN